MIIRLIFLLTVFASLMSQIPLLIDMGYDLYLKASWFILFLILLTQHPKTFCERPLWVIYSSVACMTIYCACCESFTDGKYLNVDIYNMAISMVIAIISYSTLRNYSSDSFFKHIAFVSIISSLILCTMLYQQYFTDYDISSTIYAYNNKNSIGQILLNASVIITLFVTDKNLISKILVYITIASIVIILFMLKSRATLICFFFLIFYIIIQSQNMKAKWGTLVLLTAALIYIYTNSQAYDLIVNSIFLAGRDLSDMNELSSERIYTLSEALEIIPQNLLFGIGNKYVDCMPISMTLQFGVFGALIVFVFLIALFVKINRLDRNSNLHLATYLLFITMLINSLFEAQPPFGPGVKCFMMWMSIGFSFAYEYNLPKKKYNATICEV